MGPTCQLNVKTSHSKENIMSERCVISKSKSIKRLLREQSDFGSWQIGHFPTKGNRLMSSAAGCTAYPDNHYLPNETPLYGEKKVTTTRPHNHVPVSNQLDSNLKYIFEGFSPELFLGVARYMWKTQEKIGA